MRYIDQPHSSSLISFVVFIFSLTGGVLSPKHFLSQIVASVSTNELVLARPSRFAVSCLCCNGCSLFLTYNLNSIGKIKTFCEEIGTTQLKSLHFIHPVVLRSFYATHSSASHSLNIAPITSRGKLPSSLIFLYSLIPNKNRFTSILMALLQGGRSRIIYTFFSRSFLNIGWPPLL